ncbi:gag-pol polyprotein [Tanacetum coccineum]
MAEMCMFALTVSRTEPKNIKEAMADSAWIESMQEELHQFDRLDVWELVDRPLCKNAINLKWLWKNKRDKENTVIRKQNLSFGSRGLSIPVKTQNLVGIQFLGGDKFSQDGHPKAGLHSMSSAEADHSISYNPVQHSRTSHIVVDITSYKEQVEKGLCILSDNSVCDVCTPDELEVLAIESA